MEIALVLIILVAAVYMFASEKYPIDLVAIMILGSLLITSLFASDHPGAWVHRNKWITPEDGISGFSYPATITVGAMFVLSAGLQKTGTVGAIGRLLIRLGRFPIVLLLLVIVTVGGISAFINNTAAVAVFLPLILAVAAKRKISPSKLLIPMSFASEFGGVCTLIGSSTNLLVSSISAKHPHGAGAFSMFEMGQLGIILCVAGIVYFLVVGYWILPSRRGEQLTKTYQLGEYITELRVLPKSSIIGNTILESKFGERYDVTVLEILREKKKLWAPLSEPIREDDVLLVRGKVKDLMELKSTLNLAIDPEFKLADEALRTEELVLIEAMVAPRSGLIGRTLTQLDFRRNYQAIVLAIQRRGLPLREKLNTVRLEFGDALLLLGPKEPINRMRGDENFIVLEEVEEPTMRRHKVPIALGIIGSVVGLAALDIMPIMTTAILGCVAMVVTRCVTLEEAYQAIDWRVIFLLGGVLPLGIAMEKSGAAHLIAGYTVKMVGAFGPVAVLAAFYALTAVLTECMSNNASAALLAPIAISTAVAMDISPKPLLMAVTFAASTSFATPVGYQTNMMVYSPGGYRFMDFMKVGVPLIVIFFAISVYFIPIFWPF